MGFVGRKTLHIEPTEGPLAGLDMHIRSLSMGDMFELQQLQTNSDMYSAEGQAVLNRMFKYLSDNIVEWNITDEKEEPIPFTVEGIKSIDLDTVILIFKIWTSMILEVATPLKDKSNVGSLLEVQLPPMEIL